MKVNLPKWSIIWFILLFVLALFKNFIANDRPYYCTLNGNNHYPLWHGIKNGLSAPFENKDMDSIRLHNLWHTASFSSAWYPPIPFEPGKHSQSHPVRLLPPMSQHLGLPSKFKHWLGTDADGRDIAAGLISGVRIAMITGILSMLIAVFIGVFLGALSGYFGNQGLHATKGRIMMTLISLPLAWFYGFTVRSFQIHTDQTSSSIITGILIFIGIILLFNQLGRLLHPIKFFSKTINIPTDLLVMRMIEIKSAIPPLILIVTLATLPSFGQSQWSIVLIIGLLAWGNIAQLVRAEFIKIKVLDYVTAARALGIKDLAIIWNHILPNAMQPILVAFTLGTGSAILVEATLSFLGFGGHVLQGTSWGSLIHSYQENREAWWILFFPTLVMTITLLSIHRLGEKTFS